ncbi:GntR family transcriptional regulator [Salisaeta longa]|uniref:GntR family transcriptional regulator n=1 Tax=Salisaeta longa TaxID=503170 RepID=UPI0004272C4D|nr:GntR family transcriptional regulator [Salisaeta longa]
MITIDRSAPTSVHDQLVDHVRYRIASGQYSIADTLPSTRALAQDVGVSFHTVRKAYQTLEAEGLVEAQQGRGYVVKERTPLSKGERMERGAALMQETIRQLMGLGLAPEEIDYLVQEQSQLLGDAQLEHQLYCTGPHDELNRRWADQLRSALQRTVRPVPLSHIEEQVTADFVFTPFAHLQDVMQRVPRADVLGFSAHLPADLLERVARLRSTDTLGLVTATRDSVRPLSQHIRQSSAFKGQLIAASIEDGSEHLASFIDQTDLLLHTSESHRRIASMLSERAHARLTLRIAQDAIDAIRAAVPV